ncbi:MAG: lysylphosphatidylglycerol synthase transmembrane domain-containing protein [Actinomycetota bacterium]
MEPPATATQEDEAAPEPGGGENPDDVRPRARRELGVRIFSSASDAPRARRPTDVVLLIVAFVAVAILSVPAPGPTVIDTEITDLVKALPGLFGWFWEIGWDLLIGWAATLMILALVSPRRKRLFFDQLLAVLFALGLALIGGKASGTEWSVSFDAVGASHGPPVYLAVRLAVATAVIVVTSPHMTKSLRFVGRCVVVVGAVASVALGVALPIGVLTAFIVGIGSAALVHLLVGSPGGRLTLEQVAAALDELGVEAGDVRNAPLEPRGVALATATAPDGRALLVKVYGRDAWDGQLLASTWSALWHRGETPHLGSGRLQLVEHEAFVTLLAERGGVPVLPVLAAGMAAEGDALLVSEATARSFARLDPTEVDDGLLRGVWDATERLHDLGVAHGQIDGLRIVVRPDGSPALADLGKATIAATRIALMADRAQVLVTTALAVGHERAIAAAGASLGNDGLAAILPFLQPAVFDRVTLHAVKEEEWSLDDLRKLAADAAGVEPPKLERIRRVTVRSVLLVFLVALFAYWLIASLSGIDLQELVDELQGADSAWIWGALLVTPVVQVAQAFSTIGASIHPVGFGPVLMLQYAIQFIQLAVPSSAARVALEIRFFQRMGIETGGAASIGLIDSVSGFAIQMLLILIITLSGLASLSLSSSNSSSSGGSSSGDPAGNVWVLLVVLLVLAVIIGLAVPRYRAVIKEAVPRYRAMLRDQASEAVVALRVLRHPKNVGMLFGGNLVAQVLLAIILGLCLKAFGHDATLAQLILINTIVSLFAGFMPVPGGMGVAEAGYTAGLEAIGIPSAAAMSTAIAFRLVTFYLPPIWGGLSMRWLRRHSFV